MSESASQPQPEPFAPAHRLMDDLASHRLTSTALVSDYLASIEALDPHFAAYISVYENEAMAAAGAADAARNAGQAVGPLHGIPVAVKDIVDIQGRVTTGGSKVWEQRVSSVTATLVERMLAAGMIVLGKTHTVEFAMGSFGTNQYMGDPMNPWDLHTHRAPGGSSAGSAVAVAAGLAPWAIGTDTGGSVRIPSAWCGLTGLKVSVGRISTYGVLPLSTTLDTPGPLCHDVQDAALLLQVLAGPDPRDPLTSRPTPLPSPDALAAAMARGVAGLRLAVMPESEREGVEDEVLAAFDESVARLAALGAHVETVALPESFQELGARTGEIIGVEGYHFVGDLVDDATLPVDDDVRPRIGIGRDMQAHRYYQRLREQRSVREAYEAALTGFDALLTPGTKTVAPPVASIDQTGTAAGFTRPFNFIEWCALALPNGLSSQGLPLSLQIACRGGDEAMALRIGAAFQADTDWHQRHPGLTPP